MKVIKALHITATDRKLLNELARQIVDDNIGEGDGVATKRINMTILNRDGNQYIISRKQKGRNDFGQIKNDYSKITIEV